MTRHLLVLAWIALVFAWIALTAVELLLVAAALAKGREVEALCALLVVACLALGVRLHSCRRDLRLYERLLAAEWERTRAATVTAPPPLSHETEH